MPTYDSLKHMFGPNTLKKRTVGTFPTQTVDPRTGSLVPVLPGKGADPNQPIVNEEGHFTNPHLADAARTALALQQGESILNPPLPMPPDYNKASWNAMSIADQANVLAKEGMFPQSLSPFQAARYNTVDTTNPSMLYYLMPWIVRGGAYPNSRAISSAAGTNKLTNQLLGASDAQYDTNLKNGTIRAANPKTWADKIPGITSAVDFAADVGALTLPLLSKRWPMLGKAQGAADALSSAAYPLGKNVQTSATWRQAWKDSDPSQPVRRTDNVVANTRSGRVPWMVGNWIRGGKAPGDATPWREGLAGAAQVLTGAGGIVNDGIDMGWGAVDALKNGDWGTAGGAGLGAGMQGKILWNMRNAIKNPAVRGSAWGLFAPAAALGALHQLGSMSAESSAGTKRILDDATYRDATTAARHGMRSQYGGQAGQVTKLPAMDAQRMKRVQELSNHVNENSVQTRNNVGNLVVPFRSWYNGNPRGVQESEEELSNRLKKGQPAATFQKPFQRAK